MKTKLLMTAIAGAAAFATTSASAQSVESIREVVYYNFNSAQSAEVEAQMQKITDLATSRNAQSIQVVCHTDTTGSAAYNQGLSERRAADVLNALVARGISRNIISSSGLGETSPLVPTGDNVKEQLNRRCEIDLQLEAATIEYSEPVTYTQPAQTQTYETVVEQAPYQAPTPIESTTVTTQAPYVAPEPVTTTVTTPTVTTSTAPVASTPTYVPSSPPPLPPVSGGAGGLSVPVLIGGIAAAAGAGFLIGDSGGDGDALAAAQAAQAAAESQAAAAAAAQAAAEANAANAAAAQAEAEAAAAAAAQAQADAEAAQAAAEQALADALAAASP